MFFFPKREPFLICEHLDTRHVLWKRITLFEIGREACGAVLSKSQP
jgi:hypothetical protein